MFSLPNRNCSCRKKDRKQSSLSIVGSAPQTSTYASPNGWSTPPTASPYQSFADLPPPPTFVAPSSPTTARSMPFAHTPNSEPIAIAKSHHHHHHQNKEVNISAPSSPNNSHNLYQPPRRPAHMYRNSTSGSLHSSHPSTTSLSSASSAAYYPTQGQYRNHHRSMSHYSSSPRSLDLVTPISSLSSEPAAGAQLHHHQHQHHKGDEHNNAEAGGGLLYEKKWALPAASQQGSLKKLFYFDDVRPIIETPTKSRAASPIRPLLSSNSRSTSPAAVLQHRKKVEWE